MIKNLIFDIGNVLADYNWRGFLEAQGFEPEMVERIGKAAPLSKEWNEYDRGVWTDEEILDSFVKNDPEIETEIRKAYASFRGMVKMRDYTIPWLKELKAKGYHLYYLSNFSGKARRDCSESLQFLPLMDGGILSYEDKLIKPDAAIYELLLKRYNLEAEDSVFMDDTMPNVTGAEAVGIHGIWFDTREHAIEQLKKLGVDA